MDAFATAWDACLVTHEGQQIATLKCVPILFQNLVNAGLTLAGVIAVIFIIWSGIKFVTSGGDPKQVEGARKTLTFAIIGLLIVLLSFFIIFVISYLTGAKCIETVGFEC
ncbi:MAG TPA: hypothetical protein VJC10_04165 [Patescibacteria group bacterium]|nr:hypothetical protein [Patescibacteria group bacterium]